ncbi:MAG: Flp pilus assembly protein CpaB [Dehalococcoidia bacterium]
MVRNGAIGGKANRIALVMGVLLGLATAVLVFVYLNQQSEEESTAVGPRQPVVMAKQAIPAGTRITAEMLEVRLVPTDLVLSNSFEATEPIADKVARFPIAAGEQVLATDVALSAVAVGSQATDVPLSFIVPPGMRAVSVPVSEVVSAGGLLRPGDFVDIIGIFDVVFYGVDADDPTSKEEVDKYVTMTVLQNVEVLAVAQTLEAVLPTTGGPEGSGADQRVPIERPEADPEATTVTLAVTPQEAQRLFMAEEKGELKLALRPLGETEELPLEPLADIDFLPPNLPAPFLGSR